MENSEARSSQCVRVALSIRPLELGCTDCISVVHGEPLPKVRVGSRSFTFDYVYGGSTGSPYSALYEDCVSPLVDALFLGHNATVLAYGQTASGKTYTMGTNYSGEGSNVGVIPKVMEDIFQRIEVMKDSIEFYIRVSFIEVLMDKVYDLLVPNLPKGAAPLKRARVSIQRDMRGGGTTLAGITEAVVRTKEEMAKYLSRGSHSCATESIDLNSQSSRSHAIFTITMEQKKVAHFVARVTNEDIGNDNLCAKLLLVDLASSECAERMGVDGMRREEGVSINVGLLALGKVINALGDKKRCHVLYRDSKLTCLLQDSLGGKSKTVMIACVNPTDENLTETLNTLKYANRARNIQNKAVNALKKMRMAMDGDLNKEGHKNDLRNQGYRSSFRSEDMDTFESEYLDDSDDDDWVPKSEKEEKLYCCSCSRKSSCKTMRCPCRASGGSCGTSSACSSRKCANSRTVRGGSPEFQIHEFPPD